MAVRWLGKHPREEFLAISLVDVDHLALNLGEVAQCPFFEAGDGFSPQWIFNGFRVEVIPEIPLHFRDIDCCIWKEHFFVLIEQTIDVVSMGVGHDNGVNIVGSESNRFEIVLE